MSGKRVQRQSSIITPAAPLGNEVIVKMNVSLEY